MSGQERLQSQPPKNFEISKSENFECLPGHELLEVKYKDVISLSDLKEALEAQTQYLASSTNTVDMIIEVTKDGKLPNIMLTIKSEEVMKAANEFINQENLGNIAVVGAGLIANVISFATRRVGKKLSIQCYNRRERAEKFIKTGIV